MSVMHVNAISNRLSLRKPQRDSLEILARICDIISLEKGADTSQALVVAAQTRLDERLRFECRGRYILDPHSPQ